MYIPNKSLILETIWLHYNMLIVRYTEQWKIVEFVTNNYWCPEIMKRIKQCMKECDQYQRMKNRTEILVGKLRLNKVLENLW